MTKIKEKETNSSQVLCCCVIVVIVIIIVIMLARRCAENFDPGDGNTITRYHPKNLVPKLYGRDDLSAM